MFCVFGRYSSEDSSFNEYDFDLDFDFEKDILDLDLDPIDFECEWSR